MVVKQKIKRARTAAEMMATKFKVVDFDGEWEELFGKPELRGSWIIWGESANGKTDFNMKLAKYLTRFAKVDYNSLEEGFSESLKQAIERNYMSECKRRFHILDKEPLEELELRLSKRESPDVVIIDSVQYCDLTKRSYKALLKKYPKKLFIFISHAAGKLPEGRTANAIRYDANVKIRIEGFRASIESRYGGDKSKHFTIWDKGAYEYWGEL